MKATNPNRPRLRSLPLQEEQRRLNNEKLYLNTKKAIPLVCLFLFGLVLSVSGVEFQFDAVSREAYYKALNLQFAEVRRSLPHPATPQELYVISLAEALELIATQGAARERGPTDDDADAGRLAYARLERHWPS